MTPQEAIELFKRRIRVLKQTKKPSKRSAIHAMEMAIEALERQNWIPVSERTPNEEEEVLLQFSKNQCVGFWGCEGWHINSGGGWYTDVFEDDEKPIAWVPLPEPYKGCDVE